MERVYQALLEKQPALINLKGVILLHDNARSHIKKNVNEKLNEFKWEVLPHPPYSPDLAPSDSHIFLSLQKFLNGKIFKNKHELENDITTFFESKSTNFYARWIKKLIKRWKEVIESNGNYIID